MVVTDKETALILQVELRLESACLNLADYFLFQFFEVNLPSLIFEILHMVVGEVEDRGENGRRRGTRRIHITFPDGMLVVRLLLYLIKDSKQSATKIALVGILFV